MKKRALVEDAVGAEIQTADYEQKLRVGDFQDVLDECVSKVLKVMDEDDRAELNEEDKGFISRRVGQRIGEFFNQYRAEKNKFTRFKRSERVVCRLGGDRPWACGIVASLNEDDPEDPTGQTKLPYVVKLDPPARLISVPRDDYDVCRAEVCFGQRAGALFFTLFCLPGWRSSAMKRFAVDERVAVAVEDDTNDYSVWSAGTVTDVDYKAAKEASAMLPDRDWAGKAALIPYRVQLDSGCSVLVHRDEHWLIRDLALQPAGPRQDAESARFLTRLERRHRGDYTFEAIDHATRKVRPCSPPHESDEEHGDDCMCCG